MYNLQIYEQRRQEEALAVSAHLKMYIKHITDDINTTMLSLNHVASLFSRLGPKKSYTQMKMTNKHVLVVYIMCQKTTQVSCTKSMYKFCGVTNECSLCLCPVVDTIVINMILPNYLTCINFKKLSGVQFYLTYFLNASKFFVNVFEEFGNNSQKQKKNMYLKRSHFTDFSICSF